MMANDDFYVPDEPVDEVIRAFERGEKVLTGPPAHLPTWSSTSYVSLPLQVGTVLRRTFTNMSTRELPTH